MMDPSQRALGAIVLGDPEGPEARRIVEALGVPVEKQPSWRQMRGAVVHVIGDSFWMERAVWRTSLAGAVGVLVTPLGPVTNGGHPRLDRWLRTTPLPYWTRRFHRWVLPSQEAARSWLAAGVSLGRLVVVPPGQEERLGGVYEEIRRMRA